MLMVIMNSVTKDGETYTVKFETPAGYLPTKVNGTTDGEKDSNGYCNC